MKCVIVYTEQGVPPAAISACKAKLAENGAAVAVRQVLSPFDLVPAVQSAKTQHGNDAYYLVLGVAVGTSSTESASAAFNLMSTLSSSSGNSGISTIPHISGEKLDDTASTAWALQGVQRVLSVAMPSSGAASPARFSGVPSTPPRSAAKSNQQSIPTSPASVSSALAGNAIAPSSPTPFKAASSAGPAAAAAGDGGFIKPAFYTAPEDPSVAEALAALQGSLMGRGVHGIVAIGRKFRIIDDDGSKQISLPEWRKAMAEHKLDGVLSEEQVEMLFGHFDSDDSGSISFDEFLVGIRGEMNAKRAGFVDMAFNVLDSDCSGTVELIDLMGVYDASQHPAVKDGSKTPSAVLREFLDTFDAGEKDGVVTRTEFHRYYSNVSASIDDDEYFELMIRNAWHISGGKGAAENTSNLRVLVTHEDGEQTVEEVHDDLKVRGDMEKIKQQMQARGMKVVSIEKYGGVGAKASGAAPWAVDATADSQRFGSRQNTPAKAAQSPAAAGVQQHRLTPGKAPFAGNSPAPVMPPAVPGSSRRGRSTQSSIVFG